MLGDQQPDFYADNRCDEVFRQHPAAQPEDRQRLCRPERRLVPPGAPHRAEGADPRQRCRRPATRYAYRWIDAARRARGRSITMCSSTPTARDSAAPSRRRPTIRAAAVVPRHRAGATACSSPIPMSLRPWPDRLHRRPAVLSRRRGARASSRPTSRSTACREYIAERKISPNTLSYVLDQQGRVLAASGPVARPTPADKGKVELQPYQPARQRACRQSPIGAHPRAAARRSSLQLWRPRVSRQPLDAAARVRQAMAALHHHADRPISPAPSTATTASARSSAWSRRCCRS